MHLACRFDSREAGQHHSSALTGVWPAEKAHACRVQRQLDADAVALGQELCSPSDGTPEAAGAKVLSDQGRRAQAAARTFLPACSAR
jgi:hypothetical protein